MTNLPTAWPCVAFMRPARPCSPAFPVRPRLYRLLIRPLWWCPGGYFNIIIRPIVVLVVKSLLCFFFHVVGLRATKAASLARVDHVYLLTHRYSGVPVRPQQEEPVGRTGAPFAWAEMPAVLNENWFRKARAPRPTSLPLGRASCVYPRRLFSLM